MPSTAPLAGITVLDFTRVLSGPYCTMLLADMGARVIKIEQPGKGDDTRAWGPPFIGNESAYFLSVNRNKESLTLDLKAPAARQVLARLLDKADVIVENFRPGAMARLGLDYASVAASHPSIVYCSISGFGQTGPRRDEPGYDAVIQAEGGLMSITGEADGPPFRLGVAISDVVSGMFAFQGIAMALFARTTTGRGQHVDVGMLEATAALLTYQSGNYFATGTAPRRLGNRHPTIVPYETFAASDGDFVVAVGNDALWRAFCRACGLDALGADPRYATNQQRVTAYDEIRPAIGDRLLTRTRAEWIATLERGRRAVRLGEGCRRSHRRPAARRARHGPGRRASGPRNDSRARRSHQTLGHAGKRANGAADARAAHHRNPLGRSGVHGR